MSENDQAPARAKAEVEQVAMTDGRKVGFAGKRKMVKEILADGVRFDFRNGETRTYTLSEAMTVRLALHGAAQKIGDDTAGVEDVEDMVVGVDEMISRLNRGEWGTTRASAGDSFSGASVVIRAICEATGKGMADVKAFLQKKLDGDAKLTRAALYASFRNPASKTGQIIERLEREKRSKGAAVDADSILGELA